MSSEVCMSERGLPARPLTSITQDHTLNISWNATDNFGLGEFYIGLVPAENYTGNKTAIEYTSSGGFAHYSISDPSVLRNGNKFYLSIQAVDLALQNTTLVVGPVLIDLTPPLVNGTLDVQRQGENLVLLWKEDTFIEEEDVEGRLEINYAMGKLY